MKKLVIIFVLLLSATVSAQMVDNAEIENINSQPTLGLSPSPSSFSLIDLSRINWSHSYSVSFFSGGYGSGQVGVYNANIFYEVSSKLSLSLNLGVAHDPGSLFNNNQNTNARFLPGFNLDYHPSENFRVSIGMQTYSGYDPYYYRNRYSPLR